MVILIAIATFCATFFGGLFALHLKDRLHLVLGFSAGAVIGVAFFDLLPEALELASTAYDVRFVSAIIALGFALYLLVDRLVILHRDHGEDAHHHAHHEKGAWGAGTLSLHSLLDGIGIGLAFQISTSVGIVVAAAVLAHDFSDGINTVSVILKNKGSRKDALMWLALDALAPVVGVLITFLFAVPATMLGLLLALFTGFFLYIGTSDLLPESHHGHPTYWTTIATMIGIATMYVVVLLAQ